MTINMNPDTYPLRAGPYPGSNSYANYTVNGAVSWVSEYSRGWW